MKAGILLCRFVYDTGWRRVAEVLVLRTDDRGHDLSCAGAKLAADAQDWSVGALHPRTADQSHSRERERQVDLGSAGRRRHDGNPQRLHLPQTGVTDLERVRAKGNPVEPPPRTVLHRAVAHEIAVVSDRKHVAREALRGADAARRVEREVTVLIFGIDRAVVAPAARANVAEHERDELPVPSRGAERQRVHHDAAVRVDDTVDHAVGQNPFVVQRGTPRLRDRVALGVEPTDAGAPHAAIGRIARRTDCERIGHERERVLEHAAEIEQQGGPVGASGARRVLPHPEFQKLDARKIDPSGRQRLSNRPPTRAVQ